VSDNIITFEAVRAARLLRRSRRRSDEKSLLVRNTPLNMAFRNLALAVDALDVICLGTMDNDLIAAAARSQDDMLAIMLTIPPRFRPNDDDLAALARTFEAAGSAEADRYRYEDAITVTEVVKRYGL